MRHSIAVLAAAFALVLAVGCSGAKGGGKAQVYPVEGRILVLDRPAANARIAFHPVDQSASNAVCPVGIALADGTFRLTTYAADDGAPKGDYVVTVFWPDDSIPFDECSCIDFTIHDRLRGLYADSKTSELRVTIHPEQNKIRLDAVVGGRGWNLPKLQDLDRKPERRLSPRTAEEERKLLESE